MSTLYISHPVFLRHDTGPGHPEGSARLSAVERALAAPEFSVLQRMQAPRAEPVQLQLIHSKGHVERVFAAIPQTGHHFVDADTVVSPESGEAALRAVGAVCLAVDEVMAKRARHAFCAVRPPGHHAEPDAAMGFCLFNNIAIGAAHALKNHGLQRVAIVDFDVHHGNGTQAAFKRNPAVLYVSTHQYPWYPGTGSAKETGVGNLINIPLPAGTGSTAYRKAVTDTALPAIDRFRPELILVSAGFDAHRDDPLADLELTEDDFGWITDELLKLAERHASGRLVSALEGGYDLDALSRSVAAHVRTLVAHPA
ncbi:MAG: histone deacetylase family protein [Methylococcus sp.]|nr:histone deacetylase family protein [Methylococcus sp.]